MRAYAIRRLLLMIPTLALVAFMAFILIRLVPGNAITAQIESSGQAGVQYNQQRVKALEQQLGIEGSIPSQFVHWVDGMLHGNFQRSFLTNQDTLQQFLGRVSVTLELGLLAIVFSIVIGIPIGLISGVFQDSGIDYITRFLSILALAVPNFWLALLIIVFAARVFGYAFPAGTHSLFSDPGTNLQQFVIPALVIAAASSGVIARLTRTSILDVLRQDYVRTARAKGLRQSVVIVRHALKNALVPVVTLIGGQLATVIAGAVIIEQIFNLHGVGQLTLTSVLQRDYPQVQTNVLILAVVLVFGNLATDLAYGWFDPQIRYK